MTVVPLLDLHSQQPRVLAHRGASSSAPENTLAAYSLAIEMGADTIELDIHMTRDHELVAIHDSTVDRTTDGTGPVGDMTLAEIKRLHAGSWFCSSRMHRMWGRHELSVPTLREVIELTRGKAVLRLEVKQPHLYPLIEERLVEILDEAGLLCTDDASTSVTIQSFSFESLRKLASLAPQLTLYQLTRPGADIPPSLLDEIQTYAAGICPHRRSTTRELIESAHDRGLFLHTYTVNSPEEMWAFMEFGVDGIITDNVIELKTVVREYSARTALPMAS